MPRFVLAHHPGARWAPGVPYVEQPGVMDHFAFMRRLAEHDALLAGGPFETVGDPVGMAIIEADDLTAAEALAAEDASVRGGLLTVTVREWGPRMGRWLG
jgi:uncharacterized protein YciI